MSRERNGFPPELRSQVRREQKYHCALCGLFHYGNCLKIHHIVPLSRGGENCRHNAIGLCQECHDIADTLALKEGRYLNNPQVLEEAREIRTFRNMILYERNASSF